MTQIKFNPLTGKFDLVNSDSYNDLRDKPTLGTASAYGVEDFAPALTDNDNYVTDAEKLNLHAPGSDNQVGDGITITGAGTIADPFVAVGGQPSSDEKVKLSASDPTAGYLDAKLQEGIQAIQFDTTPTQTPTEGLMYWNSTDGTLNIGMSGGDINLQVGQEFLSRVKNTTDSTISNGAVVYITGSTGDFPEVALADASDEATSRVLGVTTQEIAVNHFGYVTMQGFIRDINTDGFTNGGIIYLSTTPGQFTQTQPDAPNMNVHIGYVIRAHATDGVIAVRPRVTPKLVDLSDVDGTPLTENGQLMVWDNDNQYLDFTSNIDDFKTLVGFENRTDSTISITDGTFSLAAVNGTTGYNVWTNGTGKHNITATQTVDVIDDQTITYIYLDDTGTLQSSTSAWDIASGSNIPVSIVFKDGTSYALTDERHGAERNRAWHKWAHFNIGTMYNSGLTGTFDDTTLSVTQGVIYDEDIPFSTGVTKTTATLWYRNATDGMRMIRNSTTPYRASAGVLQYDNGSGTLQNVDNAKYVNSWVYCSNDPTEPIYIVIGQNQYLTLNEARNASRPTINLSTAEWKLIYKATFRNANGTATYGEAIDYRTVQTGVAVTSPSAASHTTLINRDAVNSHPASAITNIPAGNIIATDVQAAINELDSEKQPLSTILTNTTASFTTALESKLSGIESGAEVNNISDANALDLTDGGATILHKHSYNNLDDKPTIPTQYTDEMSQDAVGNAVGNGLDYDDVSGALSVDESELAHNSLGSKQGGTTNEYYHLTAAEVSSLHAATTVVDSTSIDLSIVGQQISASAIFGNSASTVCQGNDARLSDARTPTAHNQAESTIRFTNINTGNASTSAHGYEPKATAPASGNLNVEGIANGETARSDKLLLDSTSPSTQAYGDSASAGTSLKAARVDHKHAMPAAITDATISTSDITTNDASTTKHGFAPKVTAPASGNLNILGVANSETVRSDKLLLDSTSPSTQAFGDSASAGTSLKAARVDHKHAMPAAPTTVTGSAGSLKSPTTTGLGQLSGMGTGTTRVYTVPDADATLLYSGGALGTPASGTVTNLTGTASININGTVGATTPTTGKFTTVETTGNLELGHNSDTTISRLSAGVVGIEGKQIATTDNLIGNLTTDELLTGTVNGSNTVFTTAANFTKIQVYKNGIALHLADDFTVTGANQITMVTAPITGTKLTATYTNASTVMINGSNSLKTGETPSGTVNGSNTSFTTSQPYIANSLEVFINGVSQKRSTHFTETTPASGIFTMSDAPLTGDDIMVKYQFVSSVSGNADTLDGYHASNTLSASMIPVTDSNGFLPGGAATSWTPSWTNFTPGNATIVSKYTRVGKFIEFYISVKFGSTSSISGNMIFTLPVTSISLPGTASLQSIGLASMLDSGTATYQGVVNWLSTTTGYIQAYTQFGATYISSANFSATAPFTWTTNDEVWCTGRYEAA